MDQKDELQMKENTFQEGTAMASSSSSSSLLAHPSSLLRQVVHGFAGYLAGLCRSLQNLKPSAAPKQDADDEFAVNNTAASSSEEVENVQMKRRSTPQRWPLASIDAKL
ncbi:hypothetical protein OsI_27997 [Oryza sativa Indica Group]|uniref:Uncharacterized protein n=1 Tax=Oryza sativa subsp. indica TaxID=39946 RepID=B8BB66_ORYSI|nr:hypothetical protein OsI_27997 [Oryza sativa Indica Group]